MKSPSWLPLLNSAIKLFGYAGFQSQQVLEVVQLKNILSKAINDGANDRNNLTTRKC